VAIRFSPKLNALSRMESDILPAQIYLETSPKKAQEMVGQVLTNNQTRQSLQSDAEEKALKMLENWSENDFVFVSSEFFHRGVIGLIATKLTQIFNRPAFVGSQNSEGMIVGSGRTPQGSEISLVEALKSAESVLNRFGGHAAAAGFELHEQNQQQFIQYLKRHFESLKSNPHPLVIDFDTIADLSEVNPQVMKWYDFMGPYGVGFQVPLIQFKNVLLAGVRDLKGGHLKLQLSDAEKKNRVDALLFSPTEAIKKQIQVGQIYDLLGEMQWNYFNGQKTIQLLVKDMKPL
jgi:single-stranded-DNA-specific exonuclease